MAAALSCTPFNAPFSNFYPTGMRPDSKSAKNTVKTLVFLALLKSGGVKAACKHVGEIDPRAFYK
jgi:hypothetical protein